MIIFYFAGRERWEGVALQHYHWCESQTVCQANDIGKKGNDQSKGDIGYLGEVCIPSTWINSTALPREWEIVS